MEKRTEVIQEWIDARRERGEAATKCMFYITVPKDTDLCRDETIKKIEGMLDRNHVGHDHVDTVCGAWNLNRDWIETGEIDCIVEFCGVYPYLDLADIRAVAADETLAEIFQIPVGTPLLNMDEVDYDIEVDHALAGRNAVQIEIAPVEGASLKRQERDSV